MCKLNKRNHPKGMITISNQPDPTLYKNYARNLNKCVYGLTKNTIYQNLFIALGFCLASQVYYSCEWNGDETFSFQAKFY